MRLFRYLRAEDACEASSSSASRRNNRNSRTDNNNSNNNGQSTRSTGRSSRTFTTTNNINTTETTPAGTDQEEYIMKRRAVRREWYNEYLRPYTTTWSKSNVASDCPRRHFESDESTRVVSNSSSDTTTIATSSTGSSSQPFHFSRNNNGEDDVTVLELNENTTTAAGVVVVKSHDCEKDSMNTSDRLGLGQQQQSTMSPIYCTIIPSEPLFHHSNNNNNENILPDNNTDDDIKEQQQEEECSICFQQYCVGDQVVRSSEGSSDCPHVFHKDCILPWLERGKKRCPMCRQWFVCPKSIEEQKKEKEEQQKAIACSRLLSTRQ